MRSLRSRLWAYVFMPEQPQNACRLPSPLYKTPLTLSLSPEDGGEGTRRDAHLRLAAVGHVFNVLVHRRVGIDGVRRNAPSVVAQDLSIAAMAESTEDVHVN
jgi:hypothetical protein